MGVRGIEMGVRDVEFLVHIDASLEQVERDLWMRLLQDRALNPEILRLLAPAPRQFRLEGGFDLGGPIDVTIPVLTAHFAGLVRSSRHENPVLT